MDKAQALVMDETPLASDCFRFPLLHYVLAAPPAICLFLSQGPETVKWGAIKSTHIITPLCDSCTA